MSPGDTTFKLVAELDRSSTTYVDRGALAGVDGGLLNQTISQRARQMRDWQLIQVSTSSSLGSRIEAGVSSQLDCGRNRSRASYFYVEAVNDRYGAGGPLIPTTTSARTHARVGDWAV